MENTSQRIYRIGTRDSVLALYQAHTVQKQLTAWGVATEIIKVTSDGDKDLITPLYEMGIQGVFTKSLDIALLQDQIDLAVHSTKDVPTQQAKGLTLSAVLERATPLDCIVLHKDQVSGDIPPTGIVGTSSLRRKLQWLHKFPNYTIENLRGNIQTRLQKLDQSHWQGAIFAQAALERLDISSHHFLSLNWMLPSPAQGAIGIMCRKDDSQTILLSQKLNHTATDICITAERDFLSELQGGCTAPIAAHAQIINDELHFRGNIMSLDAQTKIEIDEVFPISKAKRAGHLAAASMRALGAEEIIKTFRAN